MLGIREAATCRAREMAGEEEKLLPSPLAPRPLCLPQAERGPQPWKLLSPMPEHFCKVPFHRPPPLPLAAVPLPSPGQREGWRRGKAAAAFYRQQFFLSFLFGLLRHKTPVSPRLTRQGAHQLGCPTARRDSSKFYTWIFNAEWFKAFFIPF